MLNVTVVPVQFSVSHFISHYVSVLYSTNEPLLNVYQRYRLCPVAAMINENFWENYTLGWNVSRMITLLLYSSFCFVCFRDNFWMWNTSAMNYVFLVNNWYKSNSRSLRVCDMVWRVLQEIIFKIEWNGKILVAHNCVLWMEHRNFWLSNFN